MEVQPEEFRARIEQAVKELMRALPDPVALSCSERRGIIARYTAVLEGNFIYWMTAALLSVRSEEARTIILGNLREEVRDCHPAMMRKFALAARAFPTDSDAMAIDRELTNVRRFLGLLSGVQIVLMMTFFEAFIQQFMGYLADLARRQGSDEYEYTDVHGVCDIAHTQELLRAVSIEMNLGETGPAPGLFDGISLLRTLILGIVQPGKSVEPVLASA